jgi:hypothetical protein
MDRRGIDYGICATGGGDLTLKAYRVIGAQLADQLARQLSLDVDTERTTETEVNGGIASLGGARRKSITKTEPIQPTDPRILEKIAEGLREHGQLKIYRPERLCELPDQPTYVHEKEVEGTPVYLPLAEGANAAPGLRGITVWVFEPLGPVGFINAESDGSFAWDWIGTYLFLIEEHIADRETTSCWSGVSALRLLVESAGYDARLYPHQAPHAYDKFGRDNSAHPIDKLRSIGGIPLRPRRIETVYRIAAMTDEQASTIEGKEVRLNDILAYPLYIADS